MSQDVSFRIFFGMASVNLSGVDSPNSFSVLPTIDMQIFSKRQRASLKIAWLYVISASILRAAKRKSVLRLSLNISHISNGLDGKQVAIIMANRCLSRDAERMVAASSIVLFQCLSSSTNPYAGKPHERKCIDSLLPNANHQKMSAFNCMKQAP